MHVPVLAAEAVAWLRILPQGTYVDCTAGMGGHASLIAALLRGGRLIGLDRDEEAVARAQARLSSFENTQVFHRNFTELEGLLAELGVDAVDGVLFDVGVSSAQLDDPARGFSFQVEGPLDMRMDTSQPLTASRLLASVDESSLAGILRDYGDVRPARRIARAIIHRRATQGLATTRDLAEAVAAGLGVTRGRPEEVRTVFQALRIAVNDELRAFESGLRQALKHLAPGGRLVTITFHSGEDRIAKQVMREAATARRVLHPDGRVKETQPAWARLLTKKPVSPGEEEESANPRSHSAKLRAVERVA